MDKDEHTPDFEDLLAAYDISDASVEPSGVRNGCVEGGPSSLSLLREVARAEMKSDVRRAGRDQSVGDAGVFENGVLGRTKQQAVSSTTSGNIASSINRIIVELGSSSPSHVITQRARKNVTASCSRPTATVITLKPNVIETTTKAKKTMRQLLPRPAQHCSTAAAVEPPQYAPQADKMVTARSPVPQQHFRAQLTKSPFGGSTARQQPDEVPDVVEAVDATSQLSTNALSPYSPRIPDPDDLWAASTGAPKGFTCLDCGDRFLVEASLMQHRQRRSVHVTLTCEACHKDVVFHNRCALFGHVRAHHERSEPSDMSRMAVKPLPPELLHHVEGASTDANAARGDPPTSSDPHDERGTKPHVGVAAASRGQYQCPECKHFCGSQLSLQEHFGHSQTRPLTAVHCERCDMVCPSACGLACHRRVHKREEPFVCPECGKAVADHWDVFQRHLSTVCFHLSRTTGLRCTTCEYLAGTEVELRDHVMDRHVKSYFKCAGCPMAFKTEGTFHGHQTAAHTREEDVKCLAIYKCPHCDVVFQNPGPLRAHLDTHATDLDGERRFLFRCTICKVIFGNKVSLQGHMRDVHPSVFKLRCKVCRSAFRDMDLLKDHEARKHPNLLPLNQGGGQDHHYQKTPPPVPPPTEQVGVEVAAADTKLPFITVKLEAPDEAEETPKEGGEEEAEEGDGCPNEDQKTVCGLCSRKFYSAHGLKMHMLRGHSGGGGGGGIISTCAVCQECHPDARSMAKHGHRHLDEGKIVCTLCNNLVFSTKFGLLRHLDGHISKFTYPLDCVYCGKDLPDADTAAPHWKAEHRLFDFCCDQCDAQYLYKKSLNRHRRSIHGDGDARKFPCTSCKGVEFSRHSLLLQHLEAKHGIPYGDRKVPDAVGKFGSALKASPAKRPAAAPTQSGKLKAESTDRTPSDSLRQPKRAKLETLDVEGRSCAKCGYKSKDRSEFVAHVRTHRADSSLYQCLECGICFVVESPLRKHLSFVHKVKDVDAFMSEKNYVAAGSLNSVCSHRNNGDAENAASDTDAVERRFECDVCHHRFETELALRTHMRTHGMAFIKIKRVSNVPVPSADKNALSSPP